MHKTYPLEMEEFVGVVARAVFWTAEGERSQSTSNYTKELGIEYDGDGRFSIAKHCLGVPCKGTTENVWIEKVR